MTSQDEPARRSRSRRDRVVWVLLLLLGGAGAWLAIIPLVPAAHQDVGPVTLVARGGFGGGETIFALPPLGRISADTHPGFLDVQVSVSDLDPLELEQKLATVSSTQELRSTLEQDLRSLALRLALQLGVAGVLSGALLAALLPRRRPLSITLGAAGGLLAALAAIATTGIAFDQQAFRQPRFTGALARAPEMIELVNRSGRSFDELGSRYDALAARLAQVLTLATDTQVDLQEDAVALLHVSDIHSNPLGLEFARKLAVAFDVDAVVDTGDITSFGAPLEARLARLIARFPVPYFLIPGNHDSFENRAQMDRLPNVGLVDGELVQVGDVSVLGWADPTFTASNETTTSEGNEVRLDAADDVAAVVREKAPDVLAVHDIRLANESFGEVGVILAGHSHERVTEQRDGTHAFVVGSTGATGVGSFLVEGDLPYEAEILYLDEGRPVALDYITLTGLGGEFEVQRQVLGGSEDEEASEVVP